MHLSGGPHHNYAKMPNAYFDYGEPLDIKTRTSTFSKVSESREDLSR